MNVWKGYKVLQAVQNSVNPMQTPTNFQSRIVIPSGQVFTPDFMVKPAVPQIAQLQSIRYAQAAPYINTGANVFKPVSQTKSGKTITPTQLNNPTTDEAIIVYQGPLKSITPQVTAMEQFDNDIEKDTLAYFKQKEEVNAEIKKVMTKKKKETPTSIFADLCIFFGFSAAGYGAYKYRAKLPLIKKLFRK